MKTESFFDDGPSWSAVPLEALAAWLLTSDFVVTKQGTTQPLRESSAAVYRFMGSKFIREVVLPQPDEEGGLVRSGKPWAAVTTNDIHTFLVGNELKRGIRNRYVRLLERMFDHLHSKGLVEGNPARGLAIKEPSKSNQHHEQTMWLNEAQQHAVIEKLPDGDGWKAKRNRALIATVLGGGLKVSEIIELREHAVGPKQEDGSLYIEVQPTGAGRRHRSKVMPLAASILAHWLRERSTFGLAGDLLFPTKPIGGMLHKATVYRQVAAVMTAAGIDPAIIKRRGARTLRNTYAVRELSNGLPIELVGEYLGHRADRSTLYYKALVRDQTEKYAGNPLSTPI